MRTALKPLLPIKNSLRAQSRAKLRDMARVERCNLAYNSANGFEAAAQQNKLDADFYDWLARRPAYRMDGPAWIAADGTYCTSQFCRIRHGWQCVVFWEGEIALIYEFSTGYGAAITLDGCLWMVREMLAADMSTRRRGIFSI